MTNEEIVEKIRTGYSVAENMHLLYEQNTPLIKRIIKPYTAYEEAEDLMQESYFGLWEAVWHYKTSENVLFMTYAPFWIERSVEHYIEKCGSLVRVPSNIRQKKIRYNKTVQKLMQELLRIPTDKEVAESMQISIAEVQTLKQHSKTISSLDVPLTDDADTTVGEMIQEDYSLEITAIEKLYREHSQNELWKILQRYTTEQENCILKEYYRHNKSMPEIAKEQDTTFSRVRESKDNALCKLGRGKAKRELCEKFEIVETNKRRIGMNKTKAQELTVEYVLMHRVALQALYEQKLKKCDESTL